VKEGRWRRRKGRDNGVSPNHVNLGKGSHNAQSSRIDLNRVDCDRKVERGHVWKGICGGGGKDGDMPEKQKMDLDRKYLHQSKLEKSTFQKDYGRVLDHQGPPFFKNKSRQEKKDNNVEEGGKTNGVGQYH